MHRSRQGVDCGEISSKLDIPLHSYTLCFWPVDPVCMGTSFIITDLVCKHGMFTELQALSSVDPHVFPPLQKTC
jgi:hypothetical protein